MNKPERSPEQIARRIAGTQSRLEELVSALALKKQHAGDDVREAIASKKNAVISTVKGSVPRKEGEAGSKVARPEDFVMKQDLLMKEDAVTNKVAGVHVVLVDDEGRPLSEDGQRRREEPLLDAG